MESQDFVLVRGDSATFTGTVYQPYPNHTLPLNLSGMSLWWTAKNEFADLDAAAVIGPKTIGAGITVLVAASGTFSVTIAATDWSLYTGNRRLLWDLQVKSGSVVTTIAKGSITVDLDVTIAIA